MDVIRTGLSGAPTSAVECFARRSEPVQKYELFTLEVEGFLTATGGGGPAIVWVTGLLGDIADSCERTVALRLSSDFHDLGRLELSSLAAAGELAVARRGLERVIDDRRAIFSASASRQRRRGLGMRLSHLPIVVLEIRWRLHVAQLYDP